MTYLDHLTEASDHIQAALVMDFVATTTPSEREALQMILDRLQDLIASEEALNRRHTEEERSR